jgi:serine/threonine kinase 17
LEIETNSHVKPIVFAPHQLTINPFLSSFFCRGNFGTVRRATHKETGIKYAAKFLRRRRRATCWIKQIQHEIAVLMLSSDSKQIVKLHAVYETRNEFVLILEM